MKFQCSACGVCCRKKYLDTLPFEFPRNPDTGDCIALGPDGLCTIYPKRPLVCRTSDLFDLYGPEIGMTRVEWYIAANERCNQMQEEAGISEAFRIDVSLYTKEQHHGTHEKDAIKGHEVTAVTQESDASKAPTDQ